MMERPEPAPPPPPPPPPAPAESAVVEDEAAAEAIAEEPPVAAPEPPVAEPPVVESYDYEDDTSQFDAAPPFRRRRNWLKVATWAGGIFALVIAGTIVAVSYWGLPDWVPVTRPTFDVAQPDLKLEFPAEQQERRQLSNGTEYFGVSGTITNIGSIARRVPPILIVLRDASDRIVYSWEVVPPQRSLAPGESVNVNEAVTDVPRSARFAEIGWKPS